MREIVALFCRTYREADQATQEFLREHTVETRERRNAADEILREATNLLFQSIGEEPPCD